MIVFAKFTPEEQTAVERIMERAVDLLPDIDRLTFRMDLSAVYAHTPLNLKALAEADGFEFGHDVAGIIRHMDRETGKLTDCFVPRFTLRIKEHDLDAPEEDGLQRAVEKLAQVLNQGGA